MPSGFILAAGAKTVPETVPWGNPTTVSGFAPLAASDDMSAALRTLAASDGALASRDILLGTDLALLVAHFNTIFHHKPTAIIMPFHEYGILQDPSGLSSSGFGSGSGYAVSHLKPTDTVLRGSVVDAQLRDRDLYLRNVLDRYTDIFAERPAERPIEIYTTGSPTRRENWRYGNGTITHRTVSQNQVTLDELRMPDWHLAETDDIMARHVAVMLKALSSAFVSAKRLYVSVSSTNANVASRESEVYVLRTDNATERVWSAEPGLNDRLVLKFNKAQNTMQWVAERHTRVFAPVRMVYSRQDGPYALIVTGDVTVRLHAVLPTRPDAEWYRLKASFMNDVPRAETTAHYATALDSTLNGVLVIGAQAPHAAFSIPEGLERGSYAVYVDVTPEGNELEPQYTLVGQSSAADASTAEFAALPGRRDVIPFALPYYDNQPTFGIRVVDRYRVNTAYGELVVGDYVELLSVTNGLAAVRRAIGNTTIEAQIPKASITKAPSVNLRINALHYKLRRAQETTPGAVGHRQWRPQLLERAMQGIVSAHNRALRSTSLQPVFEIVTLAEGRKMEPYAVRANNDSARAFSCEAGGTVATMPSLYADFIAGDTVVVLPTHGIPFTVTLLEVTDLSGKTTLTFSADLGVNLGKMVATRNAVKMSAAGLPDGISIDPYTGVLSGQVPFFTQTGAYEATISGVDTNGDVSRFVTRFFVHPASSADNQPLAAWTTDSTESWMNAMEGAGEYRIRTAFHVGLPGDIGQPALCPDGLEYDPACRSISTLRASNSIPTIRAFEPWMMDSGIYVISEDLWSPRFRKLHNDPIYGDPAVGGQVL